MPDYIRIGDAERDEAISLLQEHHAAGRLSTQEFDERMGKAMEAKVANDLAVLFTDLPGRGPGKQAEPPAPPAGTPVSYGFSPAPTGQVPLPPAGLSPADPQPAARPPKPWYAQWWIVIVAMVLTGATDGAFGYIVPLAALWVWVVYPMLVKNGTLSGGAPSAPPRPLTVTERDELMYLVRMGQKVQAIKRYRELTGADLATAKAAVDQLGRELGR